MAPARWQLIHGQHAASVHVDTFTSKAVQRFAEHFSELSLQQCKKLACCCCINARCW